MAGYDTDRMILIVTGTTIRAEDMDRPLAYSLAGEIRKRLGEETEWECIVISDLYYINNEDLHDCPVISVGGPGVNHLSQMLFRELPAAIAIDQVLLIQMDMEMQDRRACLWGMDHDTTIEALQTFLEKGYLDRFLEGAVRDDNVE